MFVHSLPCAAFLAWNMLGEIQGVSYLLNALIFVVLAATQWWISRQLYAAAKRRWEGRARVAAQALVYLLNAVVLLLYSFTLSHWMSQFGFSGPALTVLGAVGLTYAIAAAAVAGTLIALRRIRRHMGAETDPGRRRALNAAGSLAMASPFVVMGYGALVQRTDFRVREIDLPTPGLPHDLDGYRILHLSDIHLSPFLSEAELARMIDAAIELRPAAAFVTGDLISSRGDPLDACIAQIARIKTDAGIFASLGNHERYAGAEEYATEAAACAGIEFLTLQARRIRVGNATLNVGGVRYEPVSQRARYLRGAERLVIPGACNLLLSHNPDVLPAAERQGWNVMLAGHTHGGQVTVEILDQAINPARFLTPYVYGIYREGRATGHVTRGIGTIGIPARIGAPPEVALLRLRKA